MGTCGPLGDTLSLMENRSSSSLWHFGQKTADRLFGLLDWQTSPHQPRLTLLSPSGTGWSFNHTLYRIAMIPVTPELVGQQGGGA
jgi:hypothetical protein